MARTIITTKDLRRLLTGGDLRSKGSSETVVASIGSQRQFDVLFKYLDSNERLAAMRAADAIEKLTKDRPQLLSKHTKEVISIARKATNKELMWHLAQLMPRLELKGNALTAVWDLLKEWASGKQHSRIVRVFSLQALWELSEGRVRLRREVRLLMKKMYTENIPSINSRIRKLLAS